MIDTNGTDWFVHQGQQVNGWTAIQFSRSIQSCRSMDVSIRVFIFISYLINSLKFSQEQIS